MWNTPIVLVSLVAAPITLLLGPIVAYNVLITAAIALSAWCAFMVLRRYARGNVAPLIGGAVYGFSPYVLPQADLHLDLALAFVPPLFLLVIDELLRRRRSPVMLGTALGVLAAVQFLIEEELVLTSAILGAVVLGVLALQRPDQVRLYAAPLTRALVVAGGVFAVLMAWPLVVQFFGAERVQGALQNPDTFSTDALNLVVPTSHQLIAPAAATAISTHFSGLDIEANAYIGIPLLVLLVVFSVRRWSDIRVRTAAIAGAVALVLSMGPHLAVNGHSTGWPLLLWPLSQLPVIGDIEPNRIAVLMWLAIAVLVTLMVDDALSSGPAAGGADAGGRGAGARRHPARPAALDRRAGARLLPAVGQVRHRRRHHHPGGARTSATAPGPARCSGRPSPATASACPRRTPTSPGRTAPPRTGRRQRSSPT